MMRTRTTPLALLVALLATLVLVAPATAADKPDPKNSATVGIRTATATGGDDRGAYDYEILPRGVQRDWVAISNYRYAPITVRLFAKDATSTPDTAFAVQASAAAPKDLGAWIALKKSRITIPPRTEVVVPFQVGVPFDATPGDHSGALVVSLLAREPKPEGGTVVVDHRVGLRVHLRVPGDLKPALAVEKLKVGWDGGGAVLGRGDTTVTYLVRNTGNVRMDVTGDLELTRALGLPSVEATSAPIKDLLPGGTALVSQVVPDVFGTGPMKAKVHLHGVPQDEALKAQTADVTGTKGFPAWPWLLLALAVGLVALLGAGGWFERRRRTQRKAQAAEREAEEAKARANAKHRMLVRSALAALVPVLALGALLAPTSPASAAQGDQWKATISKKQGIALEPFDIQTSGGCPLPATAMVGFGYGRGFPRTGAVVVSNTEGNVTNERGFTAALVDSMKNIMALQPDPRGLAGTYRFVIRCIKPEFPDRSYGEYVAAIRFDKADHWVALPSPATKKGPVVQIPTTGPDGEPKTSPGAGGGTGVPNGGGGGAAGGGSASDRAGDLLGTSEQPVADEDGGPSWGLMAAGVVVALGSLALAFGRRIPGPWRRS